MTVPEEYGGPGGDSLYNIIQNEELGRFVGGASVGAAIATDVMTLILVEHGTHEQKQRWCPGILAGEVIQALGLTEPGSGSDVSSIQARARRDGDHFVLSGNKCYMSSGSKADLIYVVARTDDDLAKGRGAMTIFLVDAKTPGVKLARMDTLGMRASGIGECFFDDVRVPADCMLGAEGRRAAQRAQGHLHARPHVDCDARAGRGGARLRPDARLRQEPQGLRPGGVRVPEHAVQARRDEGGPRRRRGIPRQPAALARRRARSTC